MSISNGTPTQNALPDNIAEEPIDLTELDTLVDAEEDEEPLDGTPHLAAEPLFSWLLRQAVRKTNPDDAVLQNFVDLVAPRLSDYLALTSAKGGEFVQQRRAEGMSEEKVARFRHDQSLRAHIVNGLLPVIRIAKVLKGWEIPRFKHWNEITYRLLCAGYTLHDWVKLPAVKEWLGEQGLGYADPNPTLNMAVFEAQFREWCDRLNLGTFLEPIGELDQYLYELIYIAVNTQERWGTDLNQSAFPHLPLSGRERLLVTTLCTLADRLAYIAKTPPQVAESASIRELLVNLSDSQAQFIYHHVTENRGILTNFIHTSAIELAASPECIPLLFAPSGVVYLTRQSLPELPDVNAVADAAIAQIRGRCAEQLANRMMGFSRDGKGVKVAAYYDLLLTPQQQIRLAAEGVFKVIHSKKEPVSGKRFTKIAEKGWLSRQAVSDLAEDIRTDQMAEFCLFISTLASQQLPQLDADGLLLTHLGIESIREDFDILQGTKGTGGVRYEWYYAAGVYMRDKAVGLDEREWRHVITGAGDALTQAIEKLTEEMGEGTGWDELRTYIATVLSFGPHRAGRSVQSAVAAELERYLGAKLRGRKATIVCSLCSSSYDVNPQREAGLIFAPQVYTNKMPLHGSKAIRNICLICETEMMLRQIFMNTGGSTGKNYEKRKFRYVHLYPTYFYTPETLVQMHSVYGQLRHIQFSALRRELEDKSGEVAHVRLDAETFQRLQDFMMTSEPPAQDRLVRWQFPEDTPFTVAIIGIPPPARDAKDAEAWVNPAWLSLALPLVLDVKVVSSESPLPILHEADELEETIYFDAPHDYVSALIGRERINMDQLLPRLQALTVAYMIHMDGNSNLAQGKYNWHSLSPLSRRLAANSLSATEYLKRWQRRHELDTVPGDRAQLYLQYIDVLSQLNNQQGGIRMTHAQELTRLYRQFYRRTKPNSNSTLRPIAIAARAILDADPRLFDSAESLVEVVNAEVRSFMDRVGRGSADGRFAPGSDWQSRERAMHEFAQYFVQEIYWNVLGHDPASLRGKQLNLLKNACELVYVNEDAEERRRRGAAQEAQEQE